MDKKATFKAIIAEFIEKPLRPSLARSIKVPLDVPKIVSLLGARRTGKTHIMYNLIGDLRETIPADRLVYVNFEDDRLYPLRLEEMDSFVQAYYELYPQNREKQVWFFFDEVQEVPNWEKFIRRISDTEQCRIYLTGSSSRMLSRELATSLRGRTLPIEVFPLNFEEFLRFNQADLSSWNSPKNQAHILHWFDRWLAQGGFPELVFLPEELHRQTINEYIDMMLYRDLTERFEVKQPAALKYLLKFFLQNLANPISLTRVFNDLKSQGYAISKNTVFDYVSYMEEAFILFRVDIWHRSARSQAINPSKYYAIDPAFKYSMSLGHDRGRILENVVFMHLRRQGLQPHYFLEKQELDFYWENGEPLNVCLDFYDLPTREREINGMILALESLGLQEGRILTRDHSEEILSREGKRILVQPAWQYFLEA